MFLRDVDLPKVNEEGWYHPEIPVAIKINHEIILPDMDVLKDRRLSRVVRADGRVGMVYRDKKGFHAITLKG